MRTASEVLRSLEARVARLEGGRTASSKRTADFKGKMYFRDLYSLCEFIVKQAQKSGVFYQSAKVLYMAFADYLEKEQEGLLLGEWNLDAFEFELFEVRSNFNPDYVNSLEVTLDIIGDDGETTGRPVVLDIWQKGSTLVVKEAP